ncbi:MAG: hypothetical protein H0T73_04180 [Ardenticatenales bacterium]|nr:hypothetical protein [Ardenticatenales bacterium]
MYSEPLSRILSASMRRLEGEIAQRTPLMAEPVQRWMHSLAGSTHPENYFKHPVAFPMLLLPWWLEESLSPTHDERLQGDIIYSTLNGYYYIRLIDNVMDGDSSTDLSLLPAAGFFHTEFQSAYYPYFAADHPFWPYFREVWACSAESAMWDAREAVIDESHFVRVAARKVCAGKIPLAAVCYHYGRPDLIEPCAAFVDRLGCWHQMWNDLFDWNKDLTHQNQSFFLAEAERRRRAEESVAAWVVREGFEWGCTTLQRWMSELQQMALTQKSAPLEHYLQQRAAMIADQQTRVKEGFQRLAKLATLLEG